MSAQPISAIPHLYQPAHQNMQASLNADAWKHPIPKHLRCFSSPTEPSQHHVMDTVWFQPQQLIASTRRGSWEQTPTPREEPSCWKQLEKKKKKSGRVGWGKGKGKKGPVVTNLTYELEKLVGFWCTLATFGIKSERNFPVKLHFSVNPCYRHIHDPPKKSERTDKTTKHMKNFGPAKYACE